MKPDAYQALREHFADDPRVTVNSGKGAQGIKVKVKNKDKMIMEPSAVNGTRGVVRK